MVSSAIFILVMVGFTIKYLFINLFGHIYFSHSLIKPYLFIHGNYIYLIHAQFNHF